MKSTREFQLEQGLARLEKLREEAVAQPDHAVGDVVPHNDEVSRLQARVAELEAQRVWHAASHRSTCNCPSPVSRRNQPCACHGGGVEKGADILVVRGGTAARCFWGNEDRDSNRRCRVGVKNFPAFCTVLMRFTTVWREARCGSRSVRVGEASHPGPFSESDTEGLDDGAGVAVEVVPLPFELPQREAIVPGLASLDAFELSGIFRFRRRAVVMRSVPWVLRGAFRSALRIAMKEAVAGLEAFDEVKQDRAWKLFLLLPRMLLCRHARGGLVPRAKLAERFVHFARDSGLSWCRRASEAPSRISGSHSQADAARG